jgi:hypothetical protein
MRSVMQGDIHLFFRNTFGRLYKMGKKILLYVATIAVFDILIYQSIASYCNGYAQEPEIKFKQQLGSKGSGDGQFRSPHSLAANSFGNIYVGDTGNIFVNVLI